MASTDLKDAYYTVPVEKEHRKFLRFEWEGQLWQFNCMPNGLALAPRKFTKRMKPVFTTLRERGHFFYRILGRLVFASRNENGMRL